MKLISVYLGLISGILAGGMIFPANAQLISDGTTNTLVNQNGNNFNILNGIEKGNNLFHSFSNFSVPKGSSATFDLTNTPNITTIFSRVTGGNISNIDGLIQTLNGNNPASLFLMNPNGIVFGQNASLNIGGSFVGTTANNIKFADGAEFSAVNASETPLLTMSVPVGLQMGSNSGAINVQGLGHSVTQAGPFAPYIYTNNGGLQVQPGQTIALVGGDMALTGGILTAPGGRIELGSVQDGIVGLNSTVSGLTLNYNGISDFRNIQLSQRAIADVSGSGSASIQLQGRQIILSEGSAVFYDNQGNTDSGDINIYASELLELNGFDPKDNFRSSLAIQTTGTAAGGSIGVNTQRLRIINGGFLVNLQANAVGGGSIEIQATDSTVLDAVDSGDANILATGLGTTTLSSGSGGDVTITTPKFSIFNGALAVASTTSSGTGGNFTLNADEIKLIGGSPQRNRNSLISASSLGSGTAGSITLNSRTLNLQDSGEVATFGNGTGDAGQIIVNASESVEVSGNLSGAANPSRINSSVQPARPFLQQLFNLPAVPSGSSGDVIIDTPALRVANQGIVSVKNGGIGNAGNLRINADSIFLDNNGSFTAATDKGEGGNIFVQSNSLVMRRGSQISSEAGGIGNGGNISLNSSIILGLENTDIIANAVQGNGGNIDISTQGLLGLEFRPQLTPESDITASSQFGVNGTVDIDNFGIDLNSGLVELPTNLVDSSQKIAAGCAETSGSRFVATGRGGIPQNPTQQVWSDRTWSDVRDISDYQRTSTTIAEISKSSATLVQATGWHRNHQGQIELIATHSSLPIQSPLTCSAMPNHQS
ncbi:filamentous hemagglutinin N-terminal domain-containing protein [Nodularia harveyana UHCC-0300]|uniref:Filamentous hemagglutinin N-terminal domain-containing protein n=1 Tax=Nodularia harveyana UHCC-0300 TaxID=2974287 RepID=A0ABU5U935_9CYAN|nr:filamentous hemagglutinin N-terminal domain-containing protein [Nodularia harveyana]MEA5580040.1 filamentous hemagglutinin N-terminal domain-containing protein [Nodularia harveyana UHCC-0300]